MWSVVRRQRRWAGTVHQPLPQAVGVYRTLILVLLAAGCAGRRRRLARVEPGARIDRHRATHQSAADDDRAGASLLGGRLRDRAGPSRGDDPHRLLAPWLSGRNRRPALAPSRVLGIRWASPQGHPRRQPAGGRAGRRRVQGALALALPDSADEPVEAYGASDEQSMMADNTSAFNCRGVPGHRLVAARLRAAIDINPLENPEVRGGVVDPPTAAQYVDRRLHAPGMIPSRRRSRAGVLGHRLGVGRLPGTR